jgi:MFS transporter, MHS family, proline/betaine transporter
MKYSALSLAFFATIVQFYDYALFGLSAGILSQHFMPNGEEETKLLHFFAIFALAVIARPVGALIFGHIGDKYARSTSIKLASFIAMIATSAIAFIPSFEKIGYFSAILLMICRMLFSISQGGEIDLTRIYIAEKFGKRKNLANGVISFCTQCGALLAAGAYHIALSCDNVYAWRINFILGGIAGLIVLFMRDTMQESGLFMRHKAKQGRELEENLIKIIKENKRSFIIATISSGILGGSYNFLIIFLNIFGATNLEIFSLEDARVMNITLISCYGIFAIISGLIADKVVPVWQICAAIILTYASYISLMTDLTQLPYITIIFVLLMALYSVPLQILLQSLFKPTHKARLYSLSHSIGGMFFSSSIPFISMIIWKYTASAETVLAVYLVLISTLFGMVVLLKTPTDPRIKDCNKFTQ